MKSNFWKSGLVFLLTAVMVFLSACGTSNSKPAEATTEASLPANGKYDSPVQLTTVAALAPAITFKNGETMENNVHTKWAKEKFGIDLKYLWTSTTQNNAFVTRMRLALSANEPMPDVVAIDDIQLANDLIDSGKFMEVKKMWDKLASEPYKQALNEDPTMWYPFMRNDGAYGIPIPEYSGNNDTILFIRQDWLDKLNLKAPTTIEELEAVMDAFVNKDPDGNGQKDTLGLAISLKNSMKPVQATAGWVFGAYGTIPEQWLC